MSGHPIFSTFAGYSGRETENVDWIGMRYNPAWWPWTETPKIPTLGEEYFEWIDLLEAVAEAKDRFTMLDLGAGFGRWGIRAALAARKKGLRHIDIRFVEGEPQHVAWLREAVQLNGLSNDLITISDGVISYAKESIGIVVAVMDRDFDAYNWWGQWALPTATGAATHRSYLDRQVYKLALGHEIVPVQPVTFDALTEDLDVIDFVDMDIQGAERELIENAIAIFSAKVRLVHIGTHGVEIEGAIRAIFRDHGWINRWDFSLLGDRETPYGVTSFNDGVQGWSNPRLM